MNSVDNKTILCYNYFNGQISVKNREVKIQDTLRMYFDGAGTS